jgi:hypothetical protein
MFSMLTGHDRLGKCCCDDSLEKSCDKLVTMVSTYYSPGDKHLPIILSMISTHLNTVLFNQILIQSVGLYCLIMVIYGQIMNHKVL